MVLYYSYDSRFVDVFNDIVSVTLDGGAIRSVDVTLVSGAEQLYVRLDGEAGVMGRDSMVVTGVGGSISIPVGVRESVTVSLACEGRGLANVVATSVRARRV